MSNKDKYLLDTSIFLEMFKSDQKVFEQKIEDCAGGRRFAAYLTAIELNRGFLNKLVSHYKKVDEIQDVAAAIVILSNEFGGRTSKYGNILEAYMIRFSGGVSGDPRVYLSALESVLFDMTDRVNELIKHFVGHFEDHALAALSLYSNEDYEDFLEKCKSSSDVDFEEFWVDYANQLYKLRDKILAKAPRLTKDELELLEFVEATMGGGDVSYQHKSDFAISLDCPRAYEMVAHDHSFELFIPLQDKVGGYVSL